MLDDHTPLVETLELGDLTDDCVDSVPGDLDATTEPLVVALAEPSSSVAVTAADTVELCVAPEPVAERDACNGVGLLFAHRVAVVDELALPDEDAGADVDAVTLGHALPPARLADVEMVAESERVALDCALVEGDRLRDAPTVNVNAAEPLAPAWLLDAVAVVSAFDGDALDDGETDALRDDDTQTEDEAVIARYF